MLLANGCFLAFQRPPARPMRHEHGKPQVLDCVPEQARRRVRNVETLECSSTGAGDARDDRGDQDRRDEEAGDFDARGLADDDVGSGVNEDRRDHQISPRCAPGPGLSRSTPPTIDDRCNAGARHEHQHAGRVCVSLGLDAGVEISRSPPRLMMVNKITRGRMARAHSGAMP